MMAKMTTMLWTVSMLKLQFDAQNTGGPHMRSYDDEGNDEAEVGGGDDGGRGIEERGGGEGITGRGITVSGEDGSVEGELEAEAEEEVEAEGDAEFARETASHGGKGAVAEEEKMEIMVQLKEVAP